MILGQMREAQQGEVFIEEIDEDTLRSMINFIYTGDFYFHQSKDIQMMTHTADKYQL